MAVKQLSVFVQNEKGALAEVLNTIAGADIEIRALSIADTNDFGILRVITNNNEKATLALAEHHFVSSLNEVVAVRVDDAPGGLAKAVDTLQAADINVEYIYAFVGQSKNHACVVLRVDNNCLAEKTLISAGFELITEEEITNL